MATLIADKGARLSQALGQKLYDQYHGVMLGMKSTTWAVGKRVGAWPTLANAAIETNYEYLNRAG